MIVFADKLRKGFSLADLLVALAILGVIATSTIPKVLGVESLNSRIRHYLARFRRKTFCYSKGLHMVQATLTLFFTPDWMSYL